MESVKVPTDVRHLPATARLVYLAVQGTPGLTIGEIERRTGAATRSVKQALAELRERDLVERHPHPTDQRRVLYSSSGRPEVSP